MKKGDRLDDLLLELGQRAYKLLLSRGAKHHEAEDVIQESYYKLMTFLPELKIEQIKPWFYRVVLNQYIDEKRKQTKSVYVSSDFFDQIKEDESSHGSYRQVDHLDQIESEFEKIKPEYQEILTLKYYYDLSYDDIADILSIKPNSVKQKLARARQSILKERKDSNGS